MERSDLEAAEAYADVIREVECHRAIAPAPFDEEAEGRVAVAKVVSKARAACRDSLPCELHFSIDRGPETSLGIDVDVVDGVSAVVMEICAGPVQRWNDAHLERRLLSGDRIVAVNGCRGEAKRLVDRLKADTHWDLALQRPGESCLSAAGLLRGDTGGCEADVSWGLEVAYASNGTSLVIVAVHAGLVQRWNEANPKSQVRARDRVVAVNGRRGSAADLLRVVDGSADEVQEVTIRRYP